MKGTSVPDLSVVARERAALATIADTIVAASVGKGLRVAVACPNSHLALVDYLTQALHARGRACRCLHGQPNLVDAGGPAPSDQGNNSTLVLITSGLVTDTDRGVLNVNITVVAAEPAARDGNVSQRETGGAHSPAGGDPDIILDYRDPNAAMIRYMAPHLLAGGRQ
ncbi:hypothetical protein [Micromonospora coerulea]|uniref:hypothetical protein n=1 Tax=Micromonospora coerulea TaxID=47856 RepID=UPI001907CF09|nr:hypothetical protein [Micromonospora veneta]